MMISLNSLGDLKRVTAENEVQTCECITQTANEDSATNVDNALMINNRTRSRLRTIADGNNEIVTRHGTNRRALNALHQIKMLLKKTAHMLEKFGSDDFLTQKPGLLQNKIEKLIAKLNRIAERANINLEDIEDPIPDEIIENPVPDETIPVEETDLSEPIVGAGSLTPSETEIVPDAVVSPDEITPPEEEIIPDETTITDETTATDEANSDVVPLDSQDDLPALKDGLIFTIDSSLTRIVDMENNFLLEQYKLEGSLTYFSNPTRGTYSDSTDARSITNIEFMLETTRMQMMTDSGKTIYAQTMSLSMDIVSLLN